MTQPKQTLTVDHLQRYAITDIKAKNARITLVRNDGKEFTFNTAGIIGGKGEKGEKGDTGLQGESAYDIAVRHDVAKGTLEQWLESLKGDIGLQGSAGRDGSNGIDGKDSKLPVITFRPTVWLTEESKPSITLNRKDSNDLSFQLMLPVGKTGEKGEDNSKSNITTGICTFAKEPNVNIVDNQFNVTLPVGIAGEQGSNSVGRNATAPVIDLSVMYTDADKKPFVVQDGEPVLERLWTKKVTVIVPKGKTGDKGLRGQQGENRPLETSAVMKIITDVEEIQDPGKGFCCIAIDNLKGFTGKAYGYSWRNDKTTFQVVRFINTTNGFYSGWWYRNGSAEGDISESITEGWKRCSFN